jgi:hypothetical protein
MERGVAGGIARGQPFGCEQIGVDCPQTAIAGGSVQIRYLHGSFDATRVNHLHGEATPNPGVFHPQLELDLPSPWWSPR